jgi:hypothetical protein
LGTYVKIVNFAATHYALKNQGLKTITQTGLMRSLSPRERAVVRGNGAQSLTLIQ